jgi:hypothetical protein
MATSRRGPGQPLMLTFPILTRKLLSAAVPHRTCKQGGCRVGLDRHSGLSASRVVRQSRRLVSYKRHRFPSESLGQEGGFKRFRPGLIGLSTRSVQSVPNEAEPECPIASRMKSSTADWRSDNDIAAMKWP